MTTKKIRTENWNSNEKNLLISCVHERKSVIENKSNDIKLLKNKKLAWMEIANVFEANGYVRDIKRIKDQWRRMKCVAKKNVSTYERERKKTGGGTPPSEPAQTDYTIQNICPDDFVIDTSNYDTDAVTREISSTPVTLQENIEFILDPETGLLHEFNGTPTPTNSGPSLPQISLPHTSIPTIPNNASNLKSKRKISNYEEELLEIERKRVKQEMEHKEEIHKEVLQQLNLERKRKEAELEAAIFKRKREELEYNVLKEKLNKN